MQGGEMLDLTLSTLFVPRCAACDRRVAPGEALCPPCAASLDPLGSACPRCAEPLAAPVPVTCARCRLHPPPFEAMVAPWRYGGELAVALRRLKLSGVPELSRELAPLVAPFLAAAIEAAEIDLIVPVPLHWRRLAGRGFNQAQLIAIEARRAAGLVTPIDSLSLRRTRPTPTQTGLSAAQRIANVRGAFAVVPRRARRLAGRRVLLVDDIATTGATLAAATRALDDAGADGVVAFVVARAGD
jgi:ComF family protein